MPIFLDTAEKDRLEKLNPPSVTPEVFEKFLPYAPHPTEFPGPGRGYIAWQRDGVGAGQESVTLLGYDEAIQFALAHTSEHRRALDEF